MNRVLVWLGAIVLMGCSESPAPERTVAGAWRAETSLESVRLTLTESSAGTITGSGLLGTTSATVTGERDLAAVELTLTASGRALEFHGLHVGGDEMSGWFEGGGYSAGETITFRR